MSNINRHRHPRTKTSSPERELSRDDGSASSSSSITVLDVNSNSNVYNYNSPAQEEEEEKCKPHAHVYYWYRASIHTIVPHAILCLKRRNCHSPNNNHRAFNKRRSFVLFVLLIGLFLFSCYLARFYPGDQTLRATSESRARFFFSGCGVSIGRFQLGCSPPSSSSSTTLAERNYKPHVETDEDKSISWNHLFSRDLSLQEGVKEMQQLHHCYFHVLDSRPALILYDNGRMFEYNLTHPQEMESSTKIQPKGIPPEDQELEHLDNFKCTYFRAAEYREEKPHKRPKTWDIVEDGGAGKVVIINSATSLQMLEGYHESLLNHYAYAKHHGYAFVLSLVSPTKLEGRSGKFSKHLALGVHAATRQYDVSCHIDLDAWFASWDPLSRYANHWPANKDLFFGDTGQVWLNSGLMCVRPTNWAIRFLEKVVNAVYSVSSTTNTDNNERMNVGFRRDQPAVWHVLGTEWAAHNLVPYKGNQCLGWNHCNPKTPPGECWHLCFWDALQQMDWWEGLESLSQYLPHLYLEPPNKEGHNMHHHGHAHIRNSNHKDDNKNDVLTMNPPMHRMCLRSCYSVLSRAGLGMCSWMTSYYRPNHNHPNLERCSLSSSSSSSQVAVAQGSMCDGRGCLEQMEDNGGAWLKHAGHQHWLDILPSCIPLNQEEASQPCHHLRNIRSSSSSSSNTNKMTAPPPRAPSMQQETPNNIRTRRLIML
eukprot:scaffold55657_cov48-Attheya_sp.AAC.2